MNLSPRLSFLAPVAALAFAIAHIAFEHFFNGGVKTHHFLARGDLPGFSNWFGLAVLPLVAIVFAMRVRSVQRTAGIYDFPQSMSVPLIGSLLYGAVLAASFHFGAPQLSLAAFIGLFICALALPVYRAEYMLGFILGMTVTFGSVIPLIFALVFAAVSFAVRSAWRLIILLRSRRA
jgi:hypothetical protein